MNAELVSRTFVDLQLWGQLQALTTNYRIDLCNLEEAVVAGLPMI